MLRGRQTLLAKHQGLLPCLHPPRITTNVSNKSGNLLFAQSYFLETSHWQATIGKSALRLYVTDIDGHRLSRGRSMGRNLAKCLSTLTLGVGYLMSGFTARRQTLHDLIAHCLVVRR